MEPVCQSGLVEPVAHRCAGDCRSATSSSVPAGRSVRIGRAAPPGTVTAARSVAFSARGDRQRGRHANRWRVVALRRAGPVVAGRLRRPPRRRGRSTVPSPRTVGPTGRRRARRAGRVTARRGPRRGRLNGAHPLLVTSMGARGGRSARSARPRRVRTPETGAATTVPGAGRRCGPDCWPGRPPRAAYSKSVALQVGVDNENIEDDHRMLVVVPECRPPSVRWCHGARHSPARRPFPGRQ